MNIRWLVVILILSLLPLSLNAQITAKLHQPPPNQLKATDLWWVDLNNMSKETYTVYLHVIAYEKQDGRVLEGNSNTFELPPGFKRVKIGDIKEVNDLWYHPDYKNIIAKSGWFPAGEYEICVYVVDTSTKKEYTKSCINQTVSPKSPPKLIAPADDSELKEKYPLFTWIGPAPFVPGEKFNYKVRIVEVLPGQTPEQALSANIPWFEEKGVAVTTFRYPLSARSLEENRQYAWRVTAFADGFSIGDSEIWEFGLHTTEPFSIENIVEANEKITRYHMKIEYSPSLVMKEGEIDRQAQTIHLRIQPTNESIPPADFYWHKGTGYGRHAYYKRWFRIKSPEQFLDYLQALVEIVKQGSIGEVKEENGLWKIEIRLEHVPLRDNPEQFYRTVFGESGNTRTEELRKKITEAARDLTIGAHIWVSQADRTISKFTVEAATPENRSEMTVTFSPPQDNNVLLPADALKAPAQAVSLGLLFFRLGAIQGWCQPTHRLFSYRTINLIRETDSAERYSEIYAPNLGNTNPAGVPTESNHPIVIGSHNEDEETRPMLYNLWLPNANPDYYFKNNFARDNHHFGGEAMGLQYQSFFNFRDNCSDPEVGDRYYSARDWAYGGDRINPDLNRLTFTEAINQYNNYTFEGKRNAYLMFGHVLHLFQDQAMPDHTKLIAHPGSSMTDAEAYSSFQFCTVLFLELEADLFLAYLYGCGAAGPFYFGCLIACAASATIVAGAAAAICETGMDPEEMGYERLVQDRWRLSRIEPQIATSGVRTQPDFNAYFRAIAQISNTTIDRLQYFQPLGMSYHAALQGLVASSVEASLPLDPDIDSDDPSETEPYFRLTDSLALPAIAMGAGLTEYFYEVVNHPPYVRRVLVYDSPVGGSRAIETEFSGRIRYEAYWTDNYDGTGPVNRHLTGREFHRVTNEPVTPGGRNILVIELGPGINPLKGKMARRIEAAVGGVSVPLTLAATRDSIPYYWGAFTSPNCDSVPVTLPIRISAWDKSAHFSTRIPPGDEIDSNPQTIVSVGLSAPYSFRGYEPGPDTIHQVRVAPAAAGWHLELSPGNSDRLPLRPPVTHTLRLIVIPAVVSIPGGPTTIGPGTSCPVHWELEPEVTKVGPGPSETGRASRYNLDFTLTNQDALIAELKIRTTTETTRGIFLIRAACTVGTARRTADIIFEITD